MPRHQRLEPLVSIVTVNRNNALGLKRTINSVQQQTYTRWQHIIQDGGSTDTSLDVAAAVPDQRRSVVTEQDGGIYQGMNLGLARASGDLVWFLNSGDELNDSRSLERVVTSYRDRGWRWAYGSVTMLGVTPTDTYVYRRPNIKRKRVLNGMQTFPHPACVYERALLIEIGDYRPEFGPPADQELCLRAERVAPPYFIDEILSIFEPGGSAIGVSPREYEVRFRAIRRDTGELTGGSRFTDWVSEGARRMYRHAALQRSTMRGSQSRQC